jgi:hypothetical protein
MDAGKLFVEAGDIDAARALVATASNANWSFIRVNSTCSPTTAGRHMASVLRRCSSNA